MGYNKEKGGASSSLPLLKALIVILGLVILLKLLLVLFHE